MGLVYAIWSGVGIVLTAIVAYFAFGQKIDTAGLIGMGLIICGVLVINLFSQTSH
ncbi:ligand-binding protein SH3 [Aggregatibacter actinomycetemcomitans]|nr:ligand-binding protein SH3 [Aggregatibacter actinomycetemcomitans]